MLILLPLLLLLLPLILLVLLYYHTTITTVTMLDAHRDRGGGARRAAEGAWLCGSCPVRFTCCWECATGKLAIIGMIPIHIQPAGAWYKFPPADRGSQFCGHVRPWCEVRGVRKSVRWNIYDARQTLTAAVVSAAAELDQTPKSWRVKAGDSKIIEVSNAEKISREIIRCWKFTQLVVSHVSRHFSRTNRISARQSGNAGRATVGATPRHSTARREATWTWLCCSCPLRLPAPERRDWTTINR